jgi:diguanylate cyclase (GGDEF)-like protein
LQASPEQVTVSIGMHSAIPGPEDTLMDFISAADKALYKAKEQGRNGVSGQLRLTSQESFRHQREA